MKMGKICRKIDKVWLLLNSQVSLVCRRHFGGKNPCCVWSPLDHCFFGGKSVHTTSSWGRKTTDQWMREWANYRVLARSSETVSTKRVCKCIGCKKNLKWWTPFLYVPLRVGVSRCRPSRGIHFLAQQPPPPGPYHTSPHPIHSEAYFTIFFCSRYIEVLFNEIFQFNTLRIFCKPIDSMLWQSIESMGLQKILNVETGIL